MGQKCNSVFPHPITIGREDEQLLIWSDVDQRAPPCGEGLGNYGWIFIKRAGCMWCLNPNRHRQRSLHLIQGCFNLNFRSLKKMTRMRHWHQNLKTSQRMTEGRKRGAEEVKTGTEDDGGVEILMTTPENREASLPWSKCHEMFSECTDGFNLDCPPWN